MYPSAPNGVPKLKTRVPQIEKLCSDGESLDRKTKAHLRMVFDRFLELVMEDSSLFESSTYVSKIWSMFFFFQREQRNVSASDMITSTSSRIDQS